MDCSSRETRPFCCVSSPFFPAGSGGVFEKTVVLPSQEMKCGAYNCTVTKKSMIPVLTHMYTHSCADKQHLGLHEGLFRKQHLHSAQLFIINIEGILSPCSSKAATGSPNSFSTCFHRSRGLTTQTCSFLLEMSKVPFHQ